MFRIFPAPTADLYYTQEAFDFIMMLINVGYINMMMGIAATFSIFYILTNRLALAALLMLPITINIVASHAVLDNGLFTMGALLGNVFFLLNIYFLWKYRVQYKPLFIRK